MNRGELLQMLVLQAKENRSLKERLSELESRLEERELVVSRSGTLAEAALRLSGVFEAADIAVEQYRENIIRVSENQETLNRMRREEAEQQAADIVEQARMQADKSRAEADRYWEDLSRRLEDFYNAHRGLREMLSSMEVRYT